MFQLKLTFNIIPHVYHAEEYSCINKKPQWSHLKTKKNKIFFFVTLFSFYYEGGRSFIARRLFSRHSLAGVCRFAALRRLLFFLASAGSLVLITTGALTFIAHRAPCGRVRVKKRVGERERERRRSQPGKWISRTAWNEPSRGEKGLFLLGDVDLRV